MAIVLEPPGQISYNCQRRFGISRGTVQIIACIEDPPVIERILTHLASKGLPGLWAESRAPLAKRIGHS